jgi:hypothetical protein
MEVGAKKYSLLQKIANSINFLKDIFKTISGEVEVDFSRSISAVQTLLTGPGHKENNSSKNRFQTMP